MTQAIRKQEKGSSIHLGPTDVYSIIIIVDMKSEQSAKARTLSAERTGLELEIEELKISNADLAKHAKELSNTKQEFIQGVNILRQKQDFKLNALQNLIQLQGEQIHALKSQLASEEDLWENCKLEADKYNSEIEALVQELKRRQFFLAKNCSKRFQ